MRLTKEKLFKGLVSFQLTCGSQVVLILKFKYNGVIHLTIENNTRKHVSSAVTPFRSYNPDSR